MIRPDPRLGWRQRSGRAHHRPGRPRARSPRSVRIGGSRQRPRLRIARCRRAWRQYVDASWSYFATGSNRLADSVRRRWGLSLPGRPAVYIDLGFYDELKQRFGAGDFAQAYGRARDRPSRAEPADRATGARTPAAGPGKQNAYSVALELQADCYAGTCISMPRPNEPSPSSNEERQNAQSTLAPPIVEASGRCARAATFRPNPSPTVHQNNA